MANVKKTILDAYDPGLNVYVIITREADGYFLDDTGTFVAPGTSPAFPYMSADANIPSRYSYSTSANLWNDGRYILRYQRQIGVSQDVSADLLLGVGVMNIQYDEEIDIFSPEIQFDGEGV